MTRRRPTRTALARGVMSDDLPFPHRNEGLGTTLTIAHSGSDVGVIVRVSGCAPHSRNPSSGGRVHEGDTTGDPYKNQERTILSRRHDEIREPEQLEGRASSSRSLARPLSRISALPPPPDLHARASAFGLQGEPPAYLPRHQKAHDPPAIRGMIDNVVVVVAVIVLII